MRQAGWAEIVKGKQTMRKLLVRGGTTVAICLAVLVAPSIVMASDRDDQRVKEIQIRDDCDPATFNAVGLGNICSGDGHTTFATLANQVMTTGRAPKWRFTPDTVHIALSDSFRATNRGGEVHSFTQVEQVGPSVIPQVNDLLHMPGAQPNAECSTGFAKLNADPVHNNPQLSTFVLPGQSFTDTPSAPGTELYQCCIHPWMQAVVTIRQDDRKGAK
jgi:plastocyanin